MAMSGNLTAIFVALVLIDAFLGPFLSPFLSSQLKSGWEGLISRETIAKRFISWAIEKLSLIIEFNPGFFSMA